ncbi:MAG: methyltransferase domain-containing protein [Vicingaceae bacterium]
MSKKIIELSTPEVVDMADDWYVHATTSHFWIKSRYRALKNCAIFKKIAKPRFFEIGCGNGAIINQFEGDLDAVVDGCDLNMFALEQIKEEKGNVYCLNIYDKPKELIAKYDGIILMDVIEHIDDDADFVRTGMSYSKPGGYVLINVPALNKLFSRYDTAAGHKRRYTKKMLRELFDKCGLEEVRIQYWGFSLLPIALIRKVVLAFVSKENIIATGFKPPTSFVNKLFNSILKLENGLLKSPPIGTSLIAIGKIK